MVRTARGNGETETGSRRRERTWRKGRKRERERRKCTAIENFLALYGVSFVPHAFSCPIHVDGIQAIKIHITAMDCLLLVAVAMRAVRMALPPTQPVETLSCRSVKTEGDVKDA